MAAPLDTPQTYPTFTNKAIDEGIFDQLMYAAGEHIKAEYKAGRISADKYGEVYLGMLQAVLQNSTQWLTALLLLDEKRRGIDLDNQIKEFQYEYILPKELEKITAEISLMGKQEDKIDKEIEFLTWKIETEKANTLQDIAQPGSLIGKQIALLTAQRLGFAGDLQVKIGKLYADYDVVYQSVQEVEGAISLLSGAGDSKEYTVEKLDVAESIADDIMALT